MVGAATVSLSEFRTGVSGRARLHHSGDLTMLHRRRAGRRQAGVRVRTDACHAHVQQKGGRGAVWPLLLAGELRGRVALAATLAGRAQVFNHSVLGALCAQARLHSAPVELVHLECLHTSTEYSCQSFLVRRFSGEGCALWLRDEPLLAAVGGSHVSALWQCCCNFCACGRAGMGLGCGLTIRSSSIGLVG